MTEDSVAGPIETTNMEQAAAMDFEAWQHTPDEWSPAPAAEWMATAKSDLTTIRAAWLTLYKSKDELIEMVTTLEGHALAEFLNSITATSNTYYGLYTLLQAAEARLICACSAVALREGVN